MNKKTMKIVNNTTSIKISRMENKSPLRYPGGKTRACKKLELIMKEHFNVEKYDTVVSPFIGGGSFEFYLQNNYDMNIVANDKFSPLYYFWNVCKSPLKDKLCEELKKRLNKIDKEEFKSLRGKILEEEEELQKSIMYFIINRCSFSGATLSGGFSEESSKKRFTKSSIDKIQKLNLSRFEIYNEDFEDFLKKNTNERNLIFLDPPYYLEKGTKLYGNNGDMHDTFCHEKLHNFISKQKNWFMTYNNCEYIKNLYKDFKIIETSWCYGMNHTKVSSEIVIIGLK
jgi:DNA adenine methylase